jgi:SAM-dependent methyltransferase
MKKKLLEYIECNKCKKDFKLIEFETDTEIKNGILICKKCSAYYFISNYIPRFVDKKVYSDPSFEIQFAKEISQNVNPSYLRPEEDLLNELKKQNIKFFGHEWVHFNRHGFDDKVYNTKFEEQIFHEKTLLRKKEIKSKLVLDGGCGNGRYTYQAARCGAEVIGFDLGPGVHSAYENTKEFDNVHIVQADIFNLPFKDNIFNYVFSIGVIHHTGNSKRALFNLIKTLKRKGTIAVTCYHKGNIIWEFNDWWMRKITTKMSVPRLMKLSKVFADACRFCGLWIEKPVNLFFRWEPNTSIMFDWYSAPIAQHHTYPEVYSWCKQFGIDIKEDLRGEKKEWIRNIKFFRDYIAPDWAITIKGTKMNEQIKRLRPKHIYDKTKINWES